MVPERVRRRFSTLVQSVASHHLRHPQAVVGKDTAPSKGLSGTMLFGSAPALHRILPERISKEVLGPVVRDADEQWLKIVRWTIFALIEAEEVGVTSLNIDSLSAARTPAVRRVLGVEGDFGTSLGLRPTFMADAIRAVGNYSELYDRHFGPQTGAAMLRGQNALWGNGGLLYAPPIR